MTPTEMTQKIIPFYGADRPHLFAIERRSMDKEGRVIEYLDRLLRLIEFPRLVSRGSEQAVLLQSGTLTIWELLRLGRRFMPNSLSKCPKPAFRRSTGTPRPTAIPGRGPTFYTPE